ncbi:hypothetical protein OZX58_03135 [Lactobacillus sp. ESL0680]|uniref:hypothetical protein n=1 Tax=Lactobacillus sp. ESL0680 TaxID=2983210 RepID=UPI0023F93F70|nr:hypothetical protein [Lactobacillus sp. ESL0680]WEV39244.1 hypothetical protein OZX58_03135 [Lactobacillus sp. ESL0680]
MKARKKIIKQIILALNAIGTNSFSDYQKAVQELARIYETSWQQENFRILTVVFGIAVPQTEDSICKIPKKQVDKLAIFIIKNLDRK